VKLRLQSFEDSKPEIPLQSVLSSELRMALSNFLVKMNGSVLSLKLKLARLDCLVKGSEQTTHFSRFKQLHIRFLNFYFS
jgi:hypothetical protein